MPVTMPAAMRDGSTLSWKWTSEEMPDIAAPRDTDSSCLAAFAAYCAARQDRFFQMHDELYKNHEFNIRHTLQTITDNAVSAGIDKQPFMDCLGSQSPRDYVEIELQETDRFDIDSTPAIFINRRKIPSVYLEADLLRGLLNYIIKRSAR